ncbi:hypothetical protein [Vibrio alfacsensis]|uniref:hypothetical protein n=1 Tax=Vibrio TaxID=662 RepID=UPI004068CEDA
MSLPRLSRADKAGTKFVISPRAHARLLKHAASQPIALIPGVSMPTEMMEAMDLGYDGCNKR